MVHKLNEHPSGWPRGNSALESEVPAQHEQGRQDKEDDGSHDDEEEHIGKQLAGVQDSVRLPRRGRGGTSVSI
jgi:hypothetical protein